MLTAEEQDGVPTDTYGLDEAVADGHLVPPKPIFDPDRVTRPAAGIRQINESAVA